MKCGLRVVIATWILSCLSWGSALAATEYVTDRILLGVHQDASESSALIKSILSGTRVNVLDENNNFKRVRLADGTEGWVSSDYLVKSKPAVAQYDTLEVNHKKTLAALKSVKEQLAKTERELQVRRDELSNAKTTIRELKKSGATVTLKADEETLQKLAAAEQEVVNLKLAIAEMETATKQPALQPEQQVISQSLNSAEEEIATLRTRIKLALANLNGEHVPTPEELAGIRPTFPRWYWGLLVAMVVLGVILGIAWMDLRIRKRHGGFRV